MLIQILGAHNLESRDTKYVSLLIDGVLAIEAGALTSSLSQRAQQKLKAVLITHQHYDHIRDIPALGMNFWLHRNHLEICTTQPVYDALATHLMNEKLYPDFAERPPEKPTFRFRVIKPSTTEQIDGYSVLAVPMNHSVPAVGYQVTSADGKAMFYTSDTGPGLADCWRQVTPQLIITELTAPNKYKEFAHSSGHLTPALLQLELENFRKLKGYLPQVVLVHMNPMLEKQIEAEIREVAKSLNTTIQLGREGMQIQL